MTSSGRCPCPREHSSAGEAAGSPPGRSRQGLKAAAKPLLLLGTYKYVVLGFHTKACAPSFQAPIPLASSLCIISRAALCGDFHGTLCVPSQSSAGKHKTEAPRMGRTGGTRKCGLEPCPANCVTSTGI